MDWGRSQSYITMPTNQATVIETRINGMERLTYARITNSVPYLACPPMHSSDPFLCVHSSAQLCCTNGVTRAEIWQTRTQAEQERQ